MNDLIVIQVTPSEVVDKLTILDIKIDRIKDAKKRDEAVAARLALKQTVDRIEAWITGRMKELADLLRKCNESIWDAEDTLRRPGISIDEKLGACDSARMNNDLRARIKREIDAYLGAPFSEVKSHG